ncbi:MAG: metallophosphoesterase [Candidatus Caldatribacteriota bacterium]|nr:metallophosphoesterase [Candidatus Caldatribacteriota bacterium]
MKKKLIFPLIFFLSAIFLVLTLSVSATVYRIINEEGNTIRVTTEPKMNIDEKQAGCTINPLEFGIEPPEAQDNFWIKGMVFDDSNANGKMDEGEKGISKVSVSNGLTVSVTDKSGNYLLPREGYFVFITVPSDYTSTTGWYKSLSESNHFFGLKYSPEKNTEQFTFVQITDHHTDSIEEHQKIIEKAIEEINQINPDFIVATGDLILKGNEVSIEQAQEWFDVYTYLISDCKIPLFHTLGNHDVVGINYKKDLSDKPGYSKEMYRHYFGPTYYSFDWGLYHCIILDPNENFSEREFYKIPDYQIKWLKEDLSFRESYPLLVFFHEPSTTWQNQIEVLNLFKQNFTKMFSGHWHMDVLLDSRGISEQVTGAVCGEWWLGACPDNKPAGYRIVQIDGKNISSFYKEIGKSKQINIISPGPLINISEDASLTAQIYRTGDELLQEVNYRIDGGRSFPMNIKRGRLWDIANSSEYKDQLTDGYHTIAVGAQDNEGVFSREIEVKISSDNLIPLNEIISHFLTYQGNIIKIKGKIFKSFMEEPYLSKRNGVLLIKDDTGRAALIIADEYNLSDIDLEKENLITAEVVPIRYSWGMLSKKEKLLIAFCFFHLPRGFIETELLKPKAIYLLWLINFYRD